MKWVGAIVLGLALLVQPAMAQAPSLEGLWMVQRQYAPTLRGQLEIRREGEVWRARIGAELAEARAQRGRVSFTFGAHGGFRGAIARNGDLDGVWIQPSSDAEDRDDPTATAQIFASPLVLDRAGAGIWRGDVRPLDGAFTLYLRIFRNAEGALIAAFRNPEINSRGGASQFRLEQAGEALSFVARFDNGQEVRREARFDGESIRIFWPDVGSELALRRVSAQEAPLFTPRPQGSPAYVYRAPEHANDGWRTARASRVGLDESALARMVQTIIDGDPSAARPSQIHSVLVAHNGRLVLEEYFHGFDRETPHDIRSVGKTFASILVGAAIRQGADISPETRAYELLAGLGPFENPDPRKARITLAHLLTHTAGLECDDNSETSRGSEQSLWTQQAEPNFWRYTLNLPMAHEPGSHYAYCSANLNLMGAVVTTARGLSMPEAFDRDIARPLQFGPYYWNLMPNGEGYLGGGAFMRPRDLLKVGQMYLDGGVWRGRRIVSREWVEQSTSPRIEITPETTGLSEEEFSNFYNRGVDGYAWHRYGVRVGDRVVESYEANGNGGQLLVVVPEYDLVVVFTGANYMQGGIWTRWRDTYIGGVIIPAIAQ